MLVVFGLKNASSGEAARREKLGRQSGKISVLFDVLMREKRGFPFSCLQ